MLSSKWTAGDGLLFVRAATAVVPYAVPHTARLASSTCCNACCCQLGDHASSAPLCAGGAGVGCQGGNVLNLMNRGGCGVQLQTECDTTEKHIKKEDERTAEKPQQEQARRKTAVCCGWPRKRRLQTPYRCCVHVAGRRRAAAVPLQAAQARPTVTVVGRLINSPHIYL